MKEFLKKIDDDIINLLKIFPKKIERWYFNRFLIKKVKSSGKSIIYSLLREPQTWTIRQTMMYNHQFWIQFGVSPTKEAENLHVKAKAGLYGQKYGRLGEKPENIKLYQRTFFHDANQLGIWWTIKNIVFYQRLEKTGWEKYYYSTPELLIDNHKKAPWAEWPKKDNVNLWSTLSNKYKEFKQKQTAKKLAKVFGKQVNKLSEKIEKNKRIVE